MLSPVNDEALWSGCLTCDPLPGEQAKCAPDTAWMAQSQDRRFVAYRVVVLIAGLGVDPLGHLFVFCHVADIVLNNWCIKSSSPNQLPIDPAGSELK